MTSRSEALWWKMLKEKDLLEMSFILAQNALPAWKNFNHSSITRMELASLPENALKEIEANPGMFADLLVGVPSAGRRAFEKKV